MVEFEQRGHVAIVTLNRPEAKNAINRALEQALFDALERIDHDPGIRVGIVTARGETFCAGADLKERSNQVAGDKQAAIAPPARESIVSRPHAKPLIAAVEGAAIGGGLEIVLACDLLVASRTATFSLPEVKWGQLATGGGLFRLPRVVPKRIALELAITASRLDAERAYSVGLVNVLCPPGEALDQAVLMAERIAANGPLAVRFTREVMEATVHSSETDAWRITREAAERNRQSEDAKEGPLAFAEKRPPRWQAR